MFFRRNSGLLSNSLKSLLIRHVARVEGFLDPILVLANLRRFAQPSELMAPKELLRAGAIMQARGLINSQAIQHNMDWVWPYWVERQFDPGDESFMPRAFNLTHLNLTHRNWTAVGVPDHTELAIVDPRGLVTPFYDGWSIDAWMMNGQGVHLIPSRVHSARQEWRLHENPQVITRIENKDMRLCSSVDAYEQSGIVMCRIKVTALSKSGGWLAVSLRPCNPEGISFVNKISLLENNLGWKVNGHAFVHFDTAAERTQFSDYWKGDVFGQFPSLLSSDAEGVVCAVGMATAAALFKLEPDIVREITVSIPIAKNAVVKPSGESGVSVALWDEKVKGLCKADLPDKHFQFLYDAAIRSLILHSPQQDIYPGPYTYKRFWFRDAAFILDAMLCVGLSERVENILDRYPARQTSAGYYLSQDGEWDSNGEALWSIRRFCESTGKKPDPKWKQTVYRAAKWIQNKREFKKGGNSYGLLPVGFSAEHLGPNDYYYWDDFWGVAGLQASAFLAEQFGDRALAVRFTRQAEDFLSCIETSLKTVSGRTKGDAMPASPYRRMDAGAIGSLVAGYPLQLFPGQDPRLLNTAGFLLRKCFVQGGFYQEISHSGINVYLTLHIAQVYLRAGDPRYFDLMNSIATLASPTGQWPEAVHPRTKGGCMGDGQHIWAAAEWILMIRNCFVREEEGKVILCSGIATSWRTEGAEATFGPTFTSFGSIIVSIGTKGGETEIRWSGDWRKDNDPVIEIRLPGLDPAQAKAGQTSLVIPGGKP
ncbi:MAG: hypothetical protein JW937_00465 [Candidatus Omnitrophica bacterium]|nr:hypothetical protein [Candidatus Omnitrophota bacterium]